MSSSLSSTAVLNMDNSVVDHETLQALYENVSIDILQCCLELHCLLNSYNSNKSFQTSFWPPEGKIIMSMVVLVKSIYH